MGELEQQWGSGSYKSMHMQGESSSSLSSGGGSGGEMVIGGGGWRVNKEVALPILMALKESLEAEIKQVKSLINMVHGEEDLVEKQDDDDQKGYEREVLKKKTLILLEDEQDKSLELQMQIDVMKLTLSCSFSADTSASN